MPVRLSLLSQRVILAASLAASGLAGVWFLARGAESAFFQSPALAAGIGGATCLAMLILYFGACWRLRAALQDEIQGLLAAGSDLQARNSKAVRARDAKAEFLAKMSHELRTPMTAVIGYSEILIEDMVAAGRETESADVRKIYETGKHILTLINEVLDISKIDAGKMQIFPESAALGQLISDMAPGCAALASANGNTVRYDRLDGAAMVEVDCKKVRQIVSQLIGMASHVLRDGEIIVSCVLEAEWIDIHVSTLHGVIVPENMAHLGGDAQAGDADNTPDAVLGFTLAKKLCELMGGILRREDGKDGFRLTVRLPANGNAAMEAKPLDAGLSKSEAPASLALLSLPLDQESGLMKAIRNFQRRLFPGRYKVMPVR